MKNSLSLLRSIGLLLLWLSASHAQAKWCIGSTSVTLQYADGTLAVLFDGDVSFGVIPPDIDVSLSAGDTLLLHQVLSGGGSCSQPSLRISGSSLSDTADYYSPTINAYSNSTSVKIAQRGSFYVEPLGVDFGYPTRLFIDAPQEPLALGLLFTKTYYDSWGSVAPGDTCSGPCLTAYLTDGQSVHMQASSGGLAQEGGSAVVRYAPDGEPLSFDSPATIVPMVGFEAFQFSTDGMYLLSVEGPLVTGSGVAYVRVSHLPTPRLDMSLTIERADGSSEEVAYIHPNQLPSSAVTLGPGDSLRIDHHEITEPCGSVRLKVHEGPGWAPAYSNAPVVVDTPSTSAGIRIASSGSFYLEHVTDCGIPTAMTRLTINAPTPELDLVVSVRRINGTEDELFRSHVPSDTLPHLATTLALGDSIRLHYEETGYCGGYKHFSINVNDGPEDATVADPHLTGGLYGGFYGPDIAFAGAANYLIHLEGGGCYTEQKVHLHVGAPPVPHIDLQVDQLHPDGTSLTLIQAAAGGPVAFADVELAADDSIRVRDIVDQAPCTGIWLKAYRSFGDTATTQDPLFLDQPLEDAGVTFRSTGSMLFTLDDTCGALTASAHLSVSEALTTGITTSSDAGLHAYYANELLRVDTDTGGLLEIRNVAGQVVRGEEIVKGAQHLVLPFSGQSNGVYIATLRSASQVEVMRFVVY